MQTGISGEGLPTMTRSAEEGPARPGTMDRDRDRAGALSPPPAAALGVCTAQTRPRAPEADPNPSESPREADGPAAGRPRLAEASTPAPPRRPRGRSPPPARFHMQRGATHNAL